MGKFRRGFSYAASAVLIAFFLFAKTSDSASEFAPYAHNLSQSGVIAKRATEAGFRLGENLTRAEAAKIAVKIGNARVTGCAEHVFGDVGPELGDLCAYIEAAADAGIVSGWRTAFRPADSVTRAEMAKMFLAAGGVVVSNNAPAAYDDVPDSLWDLAKYVNAGAQFGCLTRLWSFRPNDTSTRGEAFKVASCVIDLSMWKPAPLVPQAAGNWKLVWSDEFDGNQLDATKWNIETGADGWGNEELQNYTDQGNVSVKDGSLIIEARKEPSGGAQYSSARINTMGKAFWTYGKIEARMKLPHGKGMWPAFWMLGENMDTVGYPMCGEIDIMEMVGGREDDTNNDAIAWGSAHRPDLAAAAGTEAVKSFTESYANPDGKNLSDDYHVFGIEWDSATIKYFVDGKQYMTVDITKNDDGYEVFHRPFFLLFNVAVGGSWPGTPDATTVWPQQMAVDWVRVYQK